ncbi:MAG: hypothetical protein H7Y07_12910 [Pyrinomonadaceae bacterium]|nr:hypothetical protein [Sphingobacteriaceae bacterium]
MIKRLILILIVSSTGILFSCKKDPAGKGDPIPPVLPPATEKLNYGDSVFYVRENISKYIIAPFTVRSGRYVAFPDGLEIDELTGEIDVNESETGLKYIVSFIATQPADTLITTMVISGINYYDKIYNLSQGDSIAAPIYNANNKLVLPGINDGNVFDESGGCKKAGIVVDYKNAIINLAKSVRNQGLDTGSTEEVKLQYRISDKSVKALNNLRVKIYFYRDVSEIPEYLTDLLKERKGTILSASVPEQPFVQSFANGINGFSVSAVAQRARPRPPCIIVVSR